MSAHTTLPPHMRLLDLIIQYEATPVFAHGEKLALILTCTKHMIEDIKAKCSAHWVETMEYDLYCMFISTAQNSPGMMARNREKLLEGLKRAVKEKVL